MNLQDTGIKNVILLQQWPGDGLKDIGIASVMACLARGGEGVCLHIGHELDMNSWK